MRSMIVMAMFAASLAGAGGRDYETLRELNLGSSGLRAVEIEAGAGNLDVRGVAGLNEIKVRALVQVPGGDDERALEIIESNLILTLERRGDRAILTAEFEDLHWSFGDSPRIQLDVQIPDHLDLAIDDGSGSIEVSDLAGDVEVEDGSGSITLSSVGGSIDIDDGSGSITAIGIGGDVAIEDGSGGITVRDVSGSVIIDDGSGGIDVREVDEDLIIVDDGSGGLDYSGIKGRVEKEGE